MSRKISSDDIIPKQIPNESLINRVFVDWLVEWGFYALSASKAIFRARTYNCNLLSRLTVIQPGVKVDGDTAWCQG